MANNSQHDGSSSFLSPYSGIEDRKSLLSHDPRNSSQASLHPTEAHLEEYHDLRELYLVYIHGFMGNETSFQSFPAHVHNILVHSMRETHVVHTKIYPKFKTRYHIAVATQGISGWLQTIETHKTDIILLGHSMGGLLCAELTFLSKPDGTPRHRILGHISLDVPFYGLHPGVVGSGIVSIFKPSPAVPPPPPFAPAQPSTWSNTLRFLGKYYDNLPKASGKWLMSHLEFGQTLSDWKGLKNRYKKIVALEQGQGSDRVRFVNYYSISLGAREGKLSHTVAKFAANDINKKEGEKNPSESSVLVASDGTRPSITLERENSAPVESSQLSLTPSASTTLTPPPLGHSSSSPDLLDLAPTDSKPEKPAKAKKPFKPRKFCLIPSSDPRKLWVPVPMYVDSEVTAHCSLFFVTSPSYTFLLEDTVDRIRDWVREVEDERFARRLAREFGGEMG